MEADIPTPGHNLQRTHGLPGRLLGDERLAQEITGGSERAFTTLFQRYHQQLYRYCRGLTGSEHDAQDALQTTFTKALVAMREGRRNAPVRPWLYRIAHNESISVIRSRNATLVDLPPELEAPQAVTDNAEQRERLATLVADLRELPEQQRGALVMRELSGLSHEEIAAALQVSVGAAKQSILEARRSLLEFAEGRAMTCDEVQRIVSDDDRRSLRSRRVRAHLRDCAPCSAFAQAIPRRRADMLALWPALPAMGSAGLLAKLTGAGSGHGGGSAGLVAGTAAKGVGATISIKVAAAAGAAVVATATVGTVAVLHQAAPARHTPVTRGAVASHRTSGADHGPAAGRSAAGAVHDAVNHHAAGGKGQGAVAGQPAQGRHGRTQGSNGHGRGPSTAPGQGTNHGQSAAPGQSTNHGKAAAPGQSTNHGKAQAPDQATNHGHSGAASKSATATHRGRGHTTHGKPVKVNPSVVNKSTNPKVGHGKAKPKRDKPLRIEGKDKPESHTKTTVNAKTTATGKGRSAAITSTTAPTTSIATSATSITTATTTTTPTTSTTSTTSSLASTVVTTTSAAPASSGDNGHGNSGTPPSQASISPSDKNAK